MPATQDPSDPIICIDMPEGELRIQKTDDDRYDIFVADVLRHPNASAESAMGALANYLHSVSYSYMKLKKASE